MNNVYSIFLNESDLDDYKEMRDIEKANYEMDKILKDMDSDLEYLKRRLIKRFKNLDIDITDPYIDNKTGEVIFKLKNYNDEENEIIEDTLNSMGKIAWSPVSGDYMNMAQGYSVSPE